MFVKSQLNSNVMTAQNCRKSAGHVAQQDAQRYQEGRPVGST
jgi:hypothetical protein